MVSEELNPSEEIRTIHTPSLLLPSNRTSEAGFTFIEALVTAVILGILAATAIPVYTGYVNSQRTNTLKSIAQMTAASANIYARRTNAAPTCATTAACVSMLGIFVSDSSEFKIEVFGNTAKVTDLVHIDVSPQTATF